jgi:hypothetical protein
MSVKIAFKLIHNLLTSKTADYLQNRLAKKSLIFLLKIGFSTRNGFANSNNKYKNLYF